MFNKWKYLFVFLIFCQIKQQVRRYHLFKNLCNKKTTAKTKKEPCEKKPPNIFCIFVRNVGK